MKPIALTLLLMELCALPATMQEVQQALIHAMAEENLPAIEAAVNLAAIHLGDKAGIGEPPDQFHIGSRDATWLTIHEATNSFAQFTNSFTRFIWWKPGMDAAKIVQPLRVPASVLSGCIAVNRAGLHRSGETMAVARQTAQFLRWAQVEGGAGLYPFPANRGVSGNRPMELADRFLRRAEAAGFLNQVVTNGWIVDDRGDGGLQFDNAECGIAMLELFEFTRDELALVSAKESANWAMKSKLVPNWNYNSFSVWLLARISRITNDAPYLQAATRKAILGVVPGQLQSGPHRGRWVDPHNARPAYHYIMLRALSELAAALPLDHPDRAKVLRSLELGLEARNAEFVKRGITNTDKALEALLTVHSNFSTDSSFLVRSHSATALGVLGRAISDQVRNGKTPLAPREYGLFLEYVLTHDPAADAKVAADPVNDFPKKQR